MSTELEPSSQEFVQSLARGLSVIRAFGADAPTMTLSEVARRTGLPRAAARRCLLTLTRLGYAELQGQRFRLRPRVLDLGYSYLSSLDFWEGIQPLLEHLANELKESCSVAVLDRTDIVYVARVQIRRIITPTVSVGTRLPAFATAMGRVLLGGLPDPEFQAYLKMAKLERFTPKTVCDKAGLREAVARSRRDRYAWVDEELDLGLRSLAVPVHDRTGAIVAAVNISVHNRRTASEAIIADYLPQLRATAEEASLLFR